MEEMTSKNPQASVIVHGFTDEQSFLYKTKLDFVKLDDMFFKSGYDVVDLYFQEEDVEDFQVIDKGYAIPLSKILDSIGTLLSHNSIDKLKRYYLVFRDIEDCEEVYVFFYLLEPKSKNPGAMPIVFTEVLGVHSSVFSFIATTKDDENRGVLDVIDHKRIVGNELIFSSFKKFINKNAFINEKSSEKELFYKRLFRLISLVLHEKSPILLYLTTLGNPEIGLPDLYNLQSIYGDGFVDMFIEHEVDKKTRSAEREIKFESFFHRLVKEKKAYFKNFMLVKKTGGLR